MDPTDAIRFGKKVDYDNKVTNTQVMEEHLKQMRNRFINNENNHVIKRKQEKEFLKQVDDLERLEQMRKMASQRAINEDFVYYNRNLMKDRVDKKMLETTEKKNDSYTYFPFVSGDLIEKHRQQLGAQLKNDLKSYLDYQKGFKTTSMTAGKMTPSKARQMKTSDIYGGLLTGSTFDGKHQTIDATRGSPVIKQLFDSDYVKPDENNRVMQDSHPHKSSTWNAALKRYEEDLKQQGNKNIRDLSNFKTSIDHDVEANQ